MNWMRRNRWTAWWVMAWMALSLTVANAAPLMSSSGALVCSASGTKWVELTAHQASSSQSKPWHCSLCLPFVAGGALSVVSLPLAIPCSATLLLEVNAFTSRTIAVYSARAPPMLQWAERPV